MTGALAELETALQAYAAAMPRGPVFGHIGNMRAVEQRLRAAATARPPRRDPIERDACGALSVLRVSGPDALSLPQLRSFCLLPEHSCRACGLPLPKTPRLLHDLFARLAREFAGGGLGPDAWRGLAQAYFRTGPGALMRELSPLLTRALPVLAERLPQSEAPGWLRYAVENPGLFGAEPCKAVAEQTLRGDMSGMDALRELLGPGREFWLWQELAAERAAQAVPLADAEFARALPGLLPGLRLLPEEPRDEALQALFERCVAGQAPNNPGVSAAEHLRPLILEAWGNYTAAAPNKYRKLGPAARRLAQEWTVRRDVRDFFQLLQEDGQADERRLEFWSHYLKPVEYHRILLGPAAQRAADPLLAELRARPTAGKLLGAEDENNALLLKTGKWLIVVSGQKRYPLFAFDCAQGAPLRPEDRDCEVPAFRDAKMSDFQLMLTDSPGQPWERAAPAALAVLGLHPDRAVPVPAPVKRAMPAGPILPGRPPPHVRARPAAKTEKKPVAAPAQNQSVAQQQKPAVQQQQPAVQQPAAKPRPLKSPLLPGKPPLHVRLRQLAMPARKPAKDGKPGAVPAQKQNPAVPTQQQQPDAPAQTQQAAPQAKPAQAPAPRPSDYSDEKFFALARALELTVEDSRAQGKPLWLLGDHQDDAYLVQKLAVWGFTWAPGRGWWKK
jgi:hypothetical protein